MRSGLVLEWHDSEVARIDAAGDILTVIFAAAQVGGAEDGYLRGVALRCEDASWQGLAGDCLGRLSAGLLRVNGARHSGLLLPAQLVGELVLELQFANGAELRIQATRLQTQMPDEGLLTEVFRC
ncbi:hypothetical protein [Chitinilyticum litopenaei]|uniref:hypothetical protein n=1 Tax=Chitinilyticum litopenaei TaxID=1121276 RepID=UPI00041E794F|nr:hypothetical protein [Chitinilyticum litopenaei]